MEPAGYHTRRFSRVRQTNVPAAAARLLSGGLLLPMHMMQLLGDQCKDHAKHGDNCRQRHQAEARHTAG